MTRRDVIILRKIIEEAATLDRMLSGLDKTHFLSNDEKQRATCMTLINIGELIKNLNDVFRGQYSQIPWRKMAGFRDVASHGYFTLNMPDVWEYAFRELPVFAKEIKEILSDNPLFEGDKSPRC